MLDVVFRLDAGGDHGAGHLMRCSALAESFLDRGYKVGFWGDIESALVPKPLQEKVVVLDTTKAPRCRLVIVDSYAPLNLLRNLIPTCIPVVLIDDEPCRNSNRPCMVVNPFGDAQMMAKHFPGADIYAGIEYAFFRSSVKEARQRYELRKHSLQDDIVVPTIMVTLGATNQSLDLQKILKELLPSVRKDTRIVVYTSKEIPGFMEPGSVGFRSISSDFLDQCAAYADLVVCGAGQTLMEMAYIGIPVIGVVVAPNQLKCGQVMAEKGVPVAMNTREFTKVLSDFRNGQTVITDNVFRQSNPEIRKLGVENRRRVEPFENQIGMSEEKLIDRMCEWIK